MVWIPSPNFCANTRSAVLTLATASYRISVCLVVSETYCVFWGVRFAFIGPQETEEEAITKERKCRKGYESFSITRSKYFFFIFFFKQQWYLTRPVTSTNYEVGVC